MEGNMKLAVKSSCRCSGFSHGCRLYPPENRTMNGMVHPAGKAGKWQQMKNLF